MSETLHKELLELYQSEFDRLVKRYSGMCNSCVMDGEDIVQEAFSRALQYIDSAPKEGGEALADWLYKICYNCFLDNRKADRMGGAVDIEEHAETLEYDPQDPITRYAKQLLKQTDKFTENMDELTKRGVRLHFQHGYSISDVQRLLGGSPDSWDRTIKKVREKVANAVSRQSYFSRGVWVPVGVD